MINMETYKMKLARERLKLGDLEREYALLDKEFSKHMEIRTKLLRSNMFSWLWDMTFVHKAKKCESLLNDLRQELKKSNALSRLVEQEIVELMERAVEKEIADFWKVMETRHE